MTSIIQDLTIDEIEIVSGGDVFDTVYKDVKDFVWGIIDGLSGSKPNYEK